MKKITSVLLPSILLGVMIIGLFGVQDAYATPTTVPLNPDAQEQSSSEIEVSWDEPLDNGGQPITHYLVYAESPNGSPLVGSPFTTPYNVLVHY